MTRSIPVFTGRQPETDRLLTVGVAVTTMVVLAGTAGQLVNYGLDLHVGALVSTEDGGAFGVVGDVALGSAALAAFALLWRVWVWHPAVVALPALLSLLAVDKTLRVHDDIVNWPLYYMPLVTATFVALVVVGRRLSGHNARLTAIGLGLLGLALVIHFTGQSVLDALGATGNGWPNQLKAVVKHGAEVAGWITVTLGLTAGAREGAANFLGSSPSLRPDGTPLRRHWSIALSRREPSGQR